MARPLNADGFVGPRHSFAPDLRHTVAAHLAAHDRTEIDDPDLRRASVAVTLVDDGTGRAGFVLTRRGAGMRNHSSQYALPGGRMDPGETATETARRELAEEVGLTAGADAVLGLLDDYRTRSGFVITPVVVWHPEPVILAPHEIEVSHAFVVHLAELDRADSPRWVTITESPKPVLQLPIYNRLIHAPTAAVLYQFREVGLHGRPWRNDGVEEPVWAWR